MADFQKQTVQWFPGHMAKTRRIIKESLNLVDGVVELVDARIPYSSSNPELDSIIKNKPRIVLLNKCDIADSNATKLWIEYYRSKGMFALPVDCRTGKGLNQFVPTVKKALSNGQISSGHARALLMVKTDSELHILFGKIVGQGMSVREAEEEAKKLNEGSRAASNKKQKKELPQKDADVLNFEQELKNIFGTKSINLKGDINKGSIVIGFDTRKDFDRIYDVLMSKR